MKSGRQTEEATKESRSPEIFLLATVNGTEKYSSSIRQMVRKERY